MDTHDGNVISFHTGSRKLAVNSTEAMRTALKAVSQVRPTPANSNGLVGMITHFPHNLTLDEFQRPTVFNRCLRTDAYEYVENNYHEIKENPQVGNNYRQINASFANLSFGLIDALRNRIQAMAMNGCGELIPLLHALDNAHEAAANAMHNLNGHGGAA